MQGTSVPNPRYPSYPRLACLVLAVQHVAEGGFELGKTKGKSGGERGAGQDALRIEQDLAKIADEHLQGDWRHGRHECRPIKNAAQRLCELAIGDRMRGDSVERAI